MKVYKRELKILTFMIVLSMTRSFSYSIRSLFKFLLKSAIVILSSCYDLCSSLLTSSSIEVVLVAIESLVLNFDDIS